MSMSQGSGVYWMTGLPRWGQAIVYAVIYSGLWQTFFGPDGFGWTRLISGVLAGVVWGVLMVVFTRNQDRQLFGSLTIGERVRVLHAVDVGETPSEPAMRTAALSVAHRRVDSRFTPRWQAVFVSGLILVAGGIALWENSTRWPQVVLLVALLAMVVPRILIVGPRQRRGAERLLAAELQAPAERR